MALIPTRAKIQNTTPNAIEDVAQQELEFIGDGNATWDRKKLGSLLKLTIVLQTKLVALLDICPNELKTMSTPKPAPKCF